MGTFFCDTLVPENNLSFLQFINDVSHCCSKSISFCLRELVTVTINYLKLNTNYICSCQNVNLNIIWKHSFHLIMLRKNVTHLYLRFQSTSTSKPLISCCSIDSSLESL